MSPLISDTYAFFELTGIYMDRWDHTLPLRHADHRSIEKLLRSLVSSFMRKVFKNQLTVVGMVPIRSGLIECGELVIERISWYDRALGYTNRAISPCSSFLKESMPVLHSKICNKRSDNNTKCGNTYNARAR